LFALVPNLAGIRDRPGGRMGDGKQQMLAIARARPTSAVEFRLVRVHREHREELGGFRPDWHWR
jgi:hypothetical protein